MPGCPTPVPGEMQASRAHWQAEDGKGGGGGGRGDDWLVNTETPWPPFSACGALESMKWEHFQGLQGGDSPTLSPLTRGGWGSEGETSQQPSQIPFKEAAAFSGLPGFFPSWLGVRAGFPPGSAGDTKRRSTYLALMYSSFSCLHTENRPGELPLCRCNAPREPAPHPSGHSRADCRDRVEHELPASRPGSHEGGSGICISAPPPTGRKLASGGLPF